MEVKMNFVAPISDLQVNEDIGNGFELRKGLLISNKQDLLEQEFLTPDFLEKFGKILSKAFFKSGNTFLYSSIVFESDESIDKLNYFKIATDCLVEANKFLIFSWLLKDNSIRAEDGYAIFSIDDKYFRYSIVPRIHRFSKADDIIEISEFGLNDLEKIKSLSNEIYKEEFNIGELNYDQMIDQGRLGTLSPLLNPLSQSLVLIASARNTGYLSIKILLYCSALETLFLRDDKELSDKLRYRVALFNSDDYDTRIKLSKTINKAYSIRSLVTHGIKRKNKKNDKFIEEIKASSIDIDNVLRSSLNKIISNEELRKIFKSRNDEQFHEFMKKLLYES